MSRFKKPTIEIPKEGKLPITKIDAAVRQLETAIQLWFYDGDPVSICTLTFAALEILDVLSNKAGKRRSAILSTDLIKEEYHQLYLDLMRSAPNFFKHGNKDADEIHYLDTASAHLLMLDAVGTYNQIGFERRAIFAIFQMWMWLTVPAIFYQKPEEVFPVGMNVALVVSQGKKKFFEAGLPIMGSQLAVPPAAPARPSPPKDPAHDSLG